MDYLENGNIKNSVNYPDCDMGICQSAFRVTILHRNIPKMLSQVTALFAEEEVNIADMTNKSKKEWAYTMLDTDTPPSKELIDKLKQITGVVKVRVIK
jgi:D-3-phosphoglycerate dehydrogenase